MWRSIDRGSPSEGFSRNRRATGLTNRETVVSGGYGFEWIPLSSDDLGNKAVEDVAPKSPARGLGEGLESLNK